MAEAKNTNTPADEAVPHLEVWDRLKNLPVIQSAIEKAGSTYSYLKDSHNLIHWGLTQAEAGLNYATATAAPIAVPLSKKYIGPISAVDQKLCEGLDIVQQKVPIVKQPPQQIYDAAKAVMSSSLQPTIEKLHTTMESATQQASTIKEVSIAKANELLNTEYGTMAVHGVDNTSVLINGLLDRYFPPVEGEQTVPAPVSADENKVLHAVQTIGQLSTKTAYRVYHSVAAQLSTVSKEDVMPYLNSVVSILHLMHVLRSDHKPNEENEMQSPVSEKK